MSRSSPYFPPVSFEISDDCLADVLACIEEDYYLVGLMRVGVQFARVAALVLSARHDLEPEQLVAYAAALRGKNMLTSGGGGCGKSYVARLVVEAAIAKMGPDSVAVCAPTGLAAANVGGVTLDSLMGSRRVRTSEYPKGVLRPPKDASTSAAQGATQAATAAAASGALVEVQDEDDDAAAASGFLDKDEAFVPLWNSRAQCTFKLLRLIVIDELSMVSSAKLDLLMAVIACYRDEKAPKIQFVFMADFHQLPPVITANSVEDRHVQKTDCGVFAFESAAWKALRVLTVELKVNRRCPNPEWNAVLNRIRMGESPCQHPSLRAELRRLTAKPVDRAEAAAAGYLAIFGRNADVRAFNSLSYERLEGPEVVVHADYSRTTWGAAPRRLPDQIYFKADMPVMLTSTVFTNFQIDSEHGSVYDTRTKVYNGTTAHVIEQGDSDLPDVSLNGAALLINGRRVTIPATQVSREFKRLGKTEKGYQYQLPLQLAAAFSVHKSQGRSIDQKLLVDITTFWRLSGMLYVSLSRTTDPSLMAVHDISSNAVAHVDPKVMQFTKRASAAPLPAWAVKARHHAAL